MEKASSKELMMSLEEWELLDLGHDGIKDYLSQKIFFDPKGIINMDYFICPSQSPYPSTPPVPPHQDDDDDDDDDDDAGAAAGGEPEEFIKDIPVVVLADQDPVSQVFFFKKMKDAEFVDMKMGSPKGSTKLILPHAEPDPTILFGEEEGLYTSEEGVEADKAASKKSSATELREEEVQEEQEQQEQKEEDNNKDKGNQVLEGFGFTVWRWRVNGIGALCSVGVAAAATICCFFIMGGKQKQKHQHQHQHQHQQQKIQFQIYTEDKRIKQAVQQATRLNQTISAMRGAPFTRAHISFGGHYHGL